MADEKRSDNEPAPVSTLLLEKLALGELDDAASQDVRARLEARGELGRLDDLMRSNAAILEALPPAQAAHQIETRLKLERERTQAPGRSFAWGGMGALAAAAAAVALIVVLPGGGDESVAPPDVPEAPEVIRTKGLSPKLVVHRRATAGVERLADGASVRAGEVLQLAYVAASARFGVIVSVDGGGAVTRHLPADGARAASLSQGGRVSLDHSYELDAAPGFERFFFVAAETPFDVDVVMEAARAAAGGASALSLPEGLEQATFLVTKPAG